MGRVKRRARLADSLFKMAAINLFKNAESEEHAFVQQQSTRKVHQAVLRERIPCPHISCAESDVFYEPVNGMYHHFRVIHNIAFTKKHLQESYALRRRLHVNETQSNLQDLFNFRRQRVSTLQIEVMFQI